MRRLEAAIAPAQRVFVVRERDGDVDEQIERLRAERGLTDRDIVVIISWFS